MHIKYSTALIALLFVAAKAPAVDQVVTVDGENYHVVSHGDNVVNLAAKLLAVKPSLTPEQVIAVITNTADPGETRTIRRINPKLALAGVATAGK